MKPRRISQKSIRPRTYRSNSYGYSREEIDHNNCLMELDTYFINTIEINRADWIKMADVMNWSTKEYEKGKEELNE